MSLTQSTERDFHISNAKSVLRINIDSLPTLVEMFGGMIERDRSKLLGYLTSDPVRNEDFRNIVNMVLEVDHKRRVEKLGGGGFSNANICGGIGVNGVRDILAFMLCHHYVCQPEFNYQTGGANPLSSLLGLNPFGSSSYKPYVCTPDDYDALSYIVDDAPKAPNPTDILKKLLPESYVERAAKTGKTGTEFIRSTTEILDKLNMALRAFDTTEGNFFEKAGKSLAQILLSTGLAVATAGTGGDNILALPTAIAKGVNMITKLFNKLAKILIRLQKMIPAVKKGLYISTAAMESAGNVTEKATKLITEVHTGEGEKIEDIQNQMQFFYNLFSVDFRGGAGGVRCWVETIFHKYLDFEDDEEYQRVYESGDPQAIKDIELRNARRIKGILCLMNEIYQEINQTLLSFIGSALDSAVPDSLGLFGILFGPIFSNFSSGIFTKVRAKAEEAWDTVFKLIQTKDKTLGTLLQNGFERPEEMYIVADYLFDRLSKTSFGLSDKLLDVLPSGAYDKLDYLMEMTGHIINKGITYMFLFINVFAVLSEIDTGSQSKYTSADIKGMLTNECPVYLKAMTELAKKGYAISKQVKTKEDAKIVGKQLATKGKSQITAKAKTQLEKEKQKIKDRAAELERTEEARIAASKQTKQTEIETTYDEQINKNFQDVLLNDEDIRYALTQMQNKFNRSDSDMKRFVIRDLRKAAMESQRNGINKDVMIDAMIDTIIYYFENN